MHRLIELVEAFGSPRVVLVGDFMLDRYVYGDTERVSPEAPVPILKVVSRDSRPGGAGNVATGIVALGGRVCCIGVLGQDQPGDELARLLSQVGADVSAMIRLPGRPTTVKTRYAGLAQHKNAQQMLRVDEEDAEPLSGETLRSIKAAVRDHLADGAVLALQDHNKGMLTDAGTAEIIAEARRIGCKVVVDPALIEDYRRYRGATVLTPNRYEADLASGIRITDDVSLERAAARILQAAEADAVMVTLDREGIFVLSGDGGGQRIAARPRAVRDGTGAGDAVSASVAVGLAEGCSLQDAAALANIVGGMEVERFGVVPITRDELIEELRRMLGLRGGKAMSRRQLTEEVTRRRQRGDRIVFTNGCFDLLHMGHVRYLQRARELGSCLIVAINSDDSVRRLKGPGRPVIGQAERAEILGSLECVDYVTIFEEDTPIALLELLKPDLLVKGGTTPEVVGRELVEAYGGKVLTLERIEGLSTTEIINRIVGNNRES